MSLCTFFGLFFFVLALIELAIIVKQQYKINNLEIKNYYLNLVKKVDK